MATQVLHDTTEWTETDPDSKLTVDETSVVSNLITSDYQSWLVKDFGAGHFAGDFEFLLSTEAIWSSGTHTATVISIQNSATGTPLGIESAAGDTINVRWQNTGSSTTGIRIRDDAASQDISINLGAESVRKYIKFYRDETIGTYGRAYCDIYSDADFATLVDPTYIDLSAKKDFRYINFGGGWHTGQTAVGALSNFNLDIQEALISESGSAHNSGTTTTTITTGTHGLTINEGDFVVFYANRAESGANITDNNGSTPFTEDYQADLDTYRYAIFSRTAGASEPTSYNFTVDSASSTLWVCHIRVFPGAEWDVAPSGATVSTGTTSTATAPTATVSDNSLGLVIVAQDTTSNCKDPTNGYGHELEKLVWNCLASYTKDFPSAGATGATSVTLDFSGDWAAHQVSLKPVAAGGDTAALTTVSGTSAVGSAGKVIAVALAGVLATASVGTVTPATGVTAALTGVSSTASAGSVDKATTITLSGEQGTSAVGTLGITLSTAVTGNEGTSAVGSLDNTLSVPITGSEGTSAVGSVGVAGSSGALLTGVSATSNAGTLLPNTSKAITGTTSTSDVGSVTNSTDVVLTGDAGTSDVGTVVASGGDTVAAVGGIGIAVERYGLGEEVTLLGRLPTGGSVTIAVYDLSDGSSVGLDSSTCTEIGSTGLYRWPATDFTAAPSSYVSYSFTMTDGTNNFDGKLVYGGYIDDLLTFPVFIGTKDA